MSVSGIFSGNFANYESENVDSQSGQNSVQQEFQQLGQDLESGNLSAAQSDFATLQQLVSPNSSTANTQNNPLAQAFNQLAQDLKSGNLSAAQQDYANIQQDFQNQASETHGHHHHHHGGGGESSEFSQLFQQLGQALQSGDLSSAQQIFSTLQQSFQQLGTSSTSSTESSQTSSSVSVSA